MDIQEMIDACIDLKKGDKEFILAGERGAWRAGIGNRTTCVALGEADPEFHGALSSDPLSAVEALLVLLERHGGVVPDPRTPEERAHDEMIDAMSDDELRAWNADRAANAKPGEIVTGYVRSSWIAAESISAESIRIAYCNPASQEP